MKRIFYIFMTLAAAGAVFLAAAGIHVYGTAGRLAVSGEVLAGSREAAAGLTVTLDAVLERHLAWRLEYSPETAAQTLSHRWSLKEADPWGTGSAELEPYANVVLTGLNTGIGSSADYLPQALDYPVQRKIYAYVTEHLDALGQFHGSVPLSEVTDVLPLGLDRLSGFKYADVSGEFAVPVPDGLVCRVDYTLDGMGGCDFSVCLRDSSQIVVNSSSAYIADGYVYLALLVRGPDGEALDASHVPGGSWGVYRMSTDALDSEELSGAFELVYAMPEGTDAMQLLPGEDTGELLLVTAEDGELRLSVLSPGGEVLERHTLSDEARLGIEPGELADYLGGGYYCSLTADNGYMILEAYPGVFVLDPGAGYASVISACTAALPVPARYDADEWYTTSGLQSYSTDGERLAVLNAGYASRSRNAPYDPDVREGYQRLSVYTADGELAYCEWLTSQFNEATYISGVSAKFTAEWLS